MESEVRGDSANHCTTVLQRIQNKLYALAINCGFSVYRDVHRKISTWVQNHLWKWHQHHISIWMFELCHARKSCLICVAAVFQCVEFWIFYTQTNDTAVVQLHLNEGFLVKIFTFHLVICACFQELARERQENGRLLRAYQDQDDLIEKLKEEIDLLNRVSAAYVICCSDVWYFECSFVFACVGSLWGL